MKTFLESVANYFLAHEGELSRMWLVFPNKRAAIFFRRYLKRNARQALAMPFLTTIGAFNAYFTEDDGDIADDIDLLFEVYESYRRVSEKHGQEPRAFDEFAFWGKMMLDDFNSIDSALADAHQLYTNIKRYNEISSTYLTSEQIKVIQQIWGDETLSAICNTKTDDFWTHTSHAADKDEDAAAAKFKRLWEIMPEIYDDFRRSLQAKGMMYPGMAERKVNKILAETSPEEYPFQKVAFIGFGNISPALGLTMEQLQRRDKALFFWDLLPEGVSYGKFASNGINRFASVFKMPSDYQPAPYTAAPNLTIVGSPSNFMQAKIAGLTIDKWSATRIDGNKPMLQTWLPDNTAVVLPDSRLLIPTLHSLPTSVGTVNITMGLSYRETPFAGVLGDIVSLHMRQRKIGGRMHFFHEDVSALILNPEVRSIAPEDCRQIQAFMDKYHQYNISAADLQERCTSGVLTAIFKPMDNPRNPDDAEAYINAVVQKLAEVMENNPEANEHNRVQVLREYASAAGRVFQAVRRYGIKDIGHGALLGLVEKILSVATLNTSGTPLKGLQVMGVLETRALDFDNLVILSLNERVFPRKRRMHSFIPQTMRRAYGLQTSDMLEAEYAYYFFRLLSRAKNVTCIYDSRVISVGGNAMSRYLQQLMYMPGHIQLQHVQAKLPVYAPEGRTIQVAKDQAVQSELAMFTKPLADGGKNISASSLKAYIKCPLKFYLEYVKRLKCDEDPTDYIDAITYGNVIHHVLQDLYVGLRAQNNGQPQVLITDQILAALIANEAGIHQRVKEELNKEFHHGAYTGRLDSMPAQSLLLGEFMVKFILAVLEKEKRFVDNYGPYTFVDAEMSFNSTARNNPCAQWQVTPNLAINVRMDIDRVDRLDDGSLRFIDYKTGADTNMVSDIANLFNGLDNNGNDAILQLLFYANVYADLTGYKGLIHPALYRLKVALADNTDFDDEAVYLKTGPKKPNIELLWANTGPEAEAPWIALYRKKLEALIAEIFNPDVPFTQTPNTDHCERCSFAELCHRQPKKKDDY